jgi:nicotinamide mononucleotide adenylyltransferase
MTCHQDARNDLSAEFDVIQGILSPVHDAYAQIKTSLNVSQVHRLAMCEAAVADSDWLTVSPWETQQGKWSRTADVLRAHHLSINAQLASQLGPIQVRLLCGSDLLESFLVPNLWSDVHRLEILATFGVVVIPREGVDLDKLIDDNPSLAAHKAVIRRAAEAVSYPVSSTIIRNLLKKGLCPRYLLPDAALSYIQRNNLWSDPLMKGEKTE